MNNLFTKKLTRTAVIAAIYATLTLVIAPLSYHTLQFRISEILVLLAFFDPLYIGGLTLGCLIANLLGPNGLPDIIFGTLGTFVSVYAISLTAKYINTSKLGLAIASIWPTIFNGLIVGWMLSKLYEIPLLIAVAEVAIGEFTVVTILGVPLMLLLKDNLSKHIIAR